MSRHDIPLKANSKFTRAIVGWDRPLQTYFVQAFVLDDEQEEIAEIWAGYSLRQLTSPEDALRLLEAICDIPANLAQLLECDRLATSGQQDGPWQTEMKKTFLP